MIAFIDDHRAVHGVEPICKLLPIAPSTYHAHLAKRDDPAKLSDRARRDAALRIEVRRVFDANFRVYGVRKTWRQLQREGFDVARCTVARLMRAMGLAGVIRSKPVRTTISDRSAPCPLDRRRPTCCGCQTSLTFRPGSGSFMWPSLSTRSPAASWAGEHHELRTPGSSWMRWSRRFTHAGRRAAAASSIIRSRQPVSLHPLHRAACRGRDRTIGRQRRRQL
jgi:hypothetical protein